MSAILDWDGAETILLFLTLLATIHLANRQTRLQTQREAGVIKGLSLLLQRWSATCSVCATLVSVEGDDDSDAIRDIDAIWAEIQRVDLFTLPTGLAISAIIETRAMMEKALRPPTLGEVLPRQRAHWEAALMDTRDLTLFWHETLDNAALRHSGAWSNARRFASPKLARPTSRLATSARELLERFKAMEAAKVSDTADQALGRVPET